jgi:hypothetical protein
VELGEFGMTKAGSWKKSRKGVWLMFLMPTAAAIGTDDRWINRKVMEYWWSGVHACVRHVSGRGEIGTRLHIIVLRDGRVR